LVISGRQDSDNVGQHDYQDVTTPACRRFLRERDEMFALSGDALLSEPRFNPDGTIDVFRWSRPQYDGPALRALACMQYMRAGGA